MRRFPASDWERRSPSEMGCSSAKFEKIGDWLQENGGDREYRVVVLRGGYLIGEWNNILPTDRRRGMASAAKSLYSNLLGIAVAEGKIPSADARVADYYPEMLEVAEGEGPKPGRYVFGKEADITFRQLISNTSGYMKPGELPGKVFNYQTDGMNILTHSLAKVYGLYDTDAPQRLPGAGKLIEDKIRARIGGSWTYAYSNFSLPSTAKIGIFGYYSQLSSHTYDLARMGYLWLNDGKWNGEQVIPADWLRDSTRTAPNIVENCPEEQWCYGLGFWTNDHGRLWQNLPRDSYAASGAGSIHIWVCPSLDLVVAQSPGIFKDQRENDGGILSLVVEASPS